jgi:hypothetical protein
MLDDFGHLVSTQRQHWTTSEFVKLLENALTERRSDIRSALETITFAREVERQLNWPVQFLLGARVWNVSWPVQAAVLTEFATAEPESVGGLRDDRSPFVERFAAFVGKGRDWAKRSGYIFDIDFFIWIDFAAQFWSRAQFKKKHPLLVEGEHHLKDIIPDQSEEKWFPAVKHLLPQMVSEFREALETEWPGRGARLFVTAYTRWENVMTTLCGGAGADEMIPVLMKVRDLAHCETLLTSIGYIADTCTSAYEWVENGHSTGIALGTVSSFSGFVHKLTTLATAAGGRARALDQRFGLKLDFNFLK